MTFVTNNLKSDVLVSCMTVKMHNLPKHKTTLSCQFVVLH